MFRELPRVTGALRAFGGDDLVASHESDDPDLQRTTLQEKRKRRVEKRSKNSFKWHEIQAEVTKFDKSSNGNLHRHLRDLSKSASDIVGNGAQPEVVESATTFLLGLLHDCPLVGRQEALVIKQMFGPFPASAATQACTAVQALMKALPKLAEQISKDRNGEENNKNSPKKREEFGHNIPYDAAQPVSLFRLWKSAAMVLKPREAANDERCSDLLAAAAAEGIHSGWLSEQCAKRTAAGMSASDMSSALFDMLTSSQSDEHLQGELFDLLGFDEMEFIQTLLTKRQLVVSASLQQQDSSCLDQTSLAAQGIVNKSGAHPSYGCQVFVQSEQEKQVRRQLRKEERRQARRQVDKDLDAREAREMMKKEREAALQAAVQAPLFQRSANIGQRVKYPFVFDALAEAVHSSAYVGGAKVLLPAGAERKNTRMFEEVTIPPTAPLPVQQHERKVKISELEPFAQLCFPNTKSLNRIQSICFDAAYKSNENLLVSAPTGAGKTNVAMLAVLHEIKQHLHGELLKRDEFKIIYVAPMKALAAEMVRNFGARLAPLGIVVREMTGDMQLTKSEIVKTQMIVTTPEKWDVTTRKGTGDVALVQAVRLLIIDEVHLLHDDRGPVIESLVARTLRQVESSQSMIRIVGLSATLPNYIDVAAFLHVNFRSGLFVFDSRFRPVPLGQTFIGIKATGVLQQIQDMNTVCYEKVHEQIVRGQQVMVFVHARNATVKTATILAEMAKSRGEASSFFPEDSKEFGAAQKQVERSKNKQLRELFSQGFGIHHAGMLRQDRTLVERLFADGFIRVLVCTATLAWGVNLPAHAVIIKGTQVYSADKGAFIDLGILDVLQIFGRAGRPQFDTHGEGIIITTHDKLSHYLSLLTRQMPIESRFERGLADNLNAEIALGTVTNLSEAVQWLNYSYWYVRMCLNPLAYGISYAQKEDDPLLEQHRRNLVISTARRLDKARMIRFHERTETLSSTDLGRTASHFYIGCGTVDLFSDLFKPQMTEDGVLSMVSQSEEFSQIKVRDDELDELECHLAENCRVPVKGGVENAYGKVNILLQTFISRANIDSFSLVSDMSYVAQNAGRIMRALFEMALRRGWPMMAARLLTMCKSVDHQLWAFVSPLHQFPILRPEVLHKLERAKLTIDRLRDMTSAEIGQMLHHPAIGSKIKDCADAFPSLLVDATCQPVTRTVLRIRLTLTPDFVWNDKLHGSAEPWWVWVEDAENDTIYYSEYFLLQKKHVRNEEPQLLVFTTPIFEPLPPQYMIRVVSDRWIGAESVFPLSFKHLILPERHPPHTDLLDLQPLPKTALNNPELEALYPHFTHFNPVQTQIFHTLYHTDCNVLLGAPTGSGKTVAAELAIFRLFREYPKAKAVYVAPLKALVRERMDDWTTRLVQKLGKRVVELTGDFTPDVQAITKADLIVTTPEKWDGVSRSWQSRGYVRQVGLIVIDEIHLLGDDRGPVLEVIVSRTNFISSHTEHGVRVVGLSTALANAKDLADWLGIQQVGLYNFRSSVRPVPLEVHVHGFPGKHYCPRMATMNKPTFEAIRLHSPAQPALVFVSSRRQTRLTALDLIAFCAAQDNPKQWLHMAEQEMETLLSRVHDANLKLSLAFGIGLHHAGLHHQDRKIVEELFVNQKIQVLIATSTLAWGVNFPAHLVVVKGTEYFDGKTKRYVDFPITDVLQMMGRAGRPQFDDKGVAVILVHDVKKDFYKKFLYEPFPVESNLLEVLPDHLNAEIVSGTVTSKQEALDYITWTYFFRRLLMNPSYYNLDETSHEAVNDYLSRLVQQALSDLESSYCLMVEEDERTIVPQTLGRIASYYYLHHSTVRSFRDGLNPTMTQNDVLKLLCDTHEYAELPVRHNEDSLNQQLAEQLGIDIPNYSFDSPHTKALLLFCAHFSRASVPCSDYLTDTKSVLDQALRILQAMVDVSADEGWLATALRCMHLVQMSVQGRWLTDSSLLTLPHFELDHVNHLANREIKLTLGGGSGVGTRHYSQCNRHLKLRSVECLPELLFAYCHDPQAVQRLLRECLGEHQLKAACSVLDHLPLVDVRLSVHVVDDGGDLGGRHQAPTSGSSLLVGSRRQPVLTVAPEQRVAARHWLKVPCDAECALHIDLRRSQCGRTKAESRVHAPKFPKTKDEGWWLVLGEIDSGELVALKRLGFLRRSQSVTLSFFSAEEPSKHVYTLFLISDSYLGLDQQYDIAVEAFHCEETGDLVLSQPEHADSADVLDMLKASHKARQAEGNPPPDSDW